ncbi:hypothetical protein AK812_SmicGene7510 [Symbiodinium microadriaticum]|uniref:Uncharacterized protein n=1 Tax=Symbiodinium microadriaticum TaxID=2951 RepID=A0A1Q9ENG0_SYMMI|nr:hypothetical protein AK812_SmicGene7510 [Symbiodinium microadriaticum]
MVMYTLPFTYAVLWFCSFSGIGIGLNGRANWLDNTGTTEFDNLDNVDYHLHADASFRPSDASKCFEAFAVYSVSTNMSRECKYSGCASSGYRFDLWAMTTGNDFVFLPRQFLSKLAMCRLWVLDDVIDFKISVNVDLAEALRQAGYPTVIAL